MKLVELVAALNGLISIVRSLEPALFSLNVKLVVESPIYNMWHRTNQYPRTQTALMIQNLPNQGTHSHYGGAQNIEKTELWKQIIFVDKIYTFECLPVSPLNFCIMTPKILPDTT